MSCASSAAWSGGPSAAPEGDARSRQRRCGRPPRALEIVAVVFTFIYAWPLAVAYLVWKFMGYPMLDEAKSFFRSKVREGFDGSFRAPFGTPGFGGTGNTAFEDYRRRELERLEEERRRLDEEAHAFRDFVEELKRAKDREEFDAFMARRRGGTQTA